MVCRSLSSLLSICTIVIALLASCPLNLDAATAPKKKAGITIPDLTKGDKIPADAKHDWNLGATGARGWMFCDKMVTTDARQIGITKITAKSPADGVLAVGDVILGVAGKPFSFDPRTEFGQAITHAESAAGKGELKVTRWRAGKTEEVAIKLPVLGSYSAQAPYDCPKSKAILEQGLKTLAERIAQPDYAKRNNPIPRSLNALALLASGDSKYLPLVKTEVEWASNFSADGFATWYYGYTMALVAEYTIATGDKSFLPGLKRLALEAAHGQSAVGSWGHKFARDDGRLFGYGMMNAPGVTLTIGMVLAQKAGVQDSDLNKAIDKSATLVRFYAGKGSVPYGDHHPWIQTHEDNGKNGMAATLFSLMDEAPTGAFFSRMGLASYGNERDTGHTGNFLNVLWSLPGIAQSGPHATGAWMKEFGHWYFDLARQADGSFVHLGPPEHKNDRFSSWDATGSYLLAYALPLKKICLTGKLKTSVPQLSPSAAQQIIEDGRGWTNKDRYSYYDAMDKKQLLERLGNWSPIVRERAAIAIGRTKKVDVDTLLKLLDEKQIEKRYGACQALAQYKTDAAKAVPALIDTLKDQDLWLRIQAADALAGIGEPAAPAIPALLERLAIGPSAKDPRGMEQRYMCFVVFDSLLKKSIEGVDRAALAKAITAGLDNQDGRARSSIGSIYNKLTYEEIKPLLPAIHEAIVKPAPSGEMFAAGIRLSGIDLLAKHKIKEGIQLCIDLLEPGDWGFGKRLKPCLKTLEKYGSAAKAMLPQLKELEADLEKQRLKQRDKTKMQPEVDFVRATIERIEKNNKPIELRSLK